MGNVEDAFLVLIVGVVVMDEFFHQSAIISNTGVSKREL